MERTKYVPSTTSYGLSENPSTQPDAEAVRKLISTMMIEHSFATGHGDTAEDLLRELFAQVNERREAVRKLVEALVEARCWMRGAGTPEERGAKCETLQDAHAMILEALKPFAPAYERALEAQSATDAGDAPIVRVPRP